ncbi:MAG: hypothetical protein ABJC19_10760 [Gemmatimonadota bacterium]
MRAVETLRISGDAKLFVPITQIAVSPAGEMAVWQAQDSRILIFSPDGRNIGSFGRAGEGPGEFRVLGAYGWLGDSLWILDPGLHRTTLMTMRGALVRIEPWLPQLTLPKPSQLVFRGGFGGAAPGAIFADGSFVPLAGVHLPQRIGADGRIGESSLESVIRVGADGVLRRVLLTTPPLARETACVQVWEAGTVSGSVSSPYCATPIKVFSPDGSRVMLVRQSNASQKSSTFEVLLISTHGDTLLHRNLEYQPQRIPSEVLRAEAGKSLPRGLTLSQMPKPYRDALGRLPRVDQYPPIGRGLLGTDGAIWLELNGPWKEHRWLLLSSEDGSVIGNLELSPSITLRAVSRGMVWGREVDDDDVPSVVRLRVVGP